MESREWRTLANKTLDFIAIAKEKDFCFDLLHIIERRLFNLSPFSIHKKGVKKMRKVSLDEVFQMASEARESIWAQAKNVGREPKIYLHWTAGHYHNLFADYHVNIDGDGQLWVEKDFDVTVNHTWKRNTGAIGIAICGCYGAGSQTLGAEPPTKKQIEMMAQVIWKIADALWLTIDKAHVLTHGEAANNEDGDCSCHDPYPWWNDSYGDGDTRGDLEYLGTEESPCYNPYATDGTRGGDVLRGKANWYRSTYKEE